MSNTMSTPLFFVIFKIISATSSFIPDIEANSCSRPSTLTATTGEENSNFDWYNGQHHYIQLSPF